MIRSEVAHLLTAASSHPGMTGKNNEDRYAVTAHRLSASNPTPSLLAVLCDGVGGHRGGEVAAEIAVNTIGQVVAESDASQPVQVLQKAVKAASQHIYARAQENGELRGMGSTCVCAWVIADRLYTVSVGDSRIYLQRGDAIYQLTTDHTFVQELLEKGLITEDQMRTHPNAHVIRRYLGSPTPPDGDFRLKLGVETGNEAAISNQGLGLQAGDRVLLCTDGLTDLVSDAEIRSTLDSHLPSNPDRAPRLSRADKRAPNGQPPSDAIDKLSGAVQGLINLANQRGGHDNITVIVMQVPARLPVQATPGWFSRKWRLAMVGCLGLVTLALFAGVVLYGLNWQQGLFQLINGQQTPSITATLNSTPGVPGGVPLTAVPSFTQTLSGVPTTSFDLTFTPTLIATPGASLTPWPTNTLQP